LVAFGVFSTINPGTIVSAFSTVTATYIVQLHAVGIKVILSLGGASTSISSTTVSFQQVRLAAGSDAVFQSAFIASVQNFISQYGFDGIDIDIESGLIPAGTFADSTGDILVLSNIINQLKSTNPSLLITLAPQAANTSPNGGFNSIFGNYASLILKTASSLTWVGIQLYNTGCCYGLDKVCYSIDAANPDFSVAMAAGLLENWPSVGPTGLVTGFQPYVSPLTADQVVLGYPCVNGGGSSDGWPATPTSTIKRAIQCLRTGTNCNTYKPPRLYPTIGGVFEWSVNYDQLNNYKFATDLVPCVVNGNCS
jgi:chitinase